MLAYIFDHTYDLLIKVETRLIHKRSSKDFLEYFCIKVICLLDESIQIFME